MLPLKFWRDHSKEMMLKYGLKKVTYEDIKKIYRKWKQ